ncbi:MAG: hypothetical protein WEA09_14825 [Gemmatimonadota bacterium]
MRRPFSIGPVGPLLLVLPLSSCGGSDAGSEASDTASAATAAQAFMANLARHCGNAYPGGLALAPEGDQMLAGDELLVVHFRVCGEDENLLPFHIQQDGGASWDRSRTWIFRTAAEGRLELRHDHRQSDGTEDEVTWYGAFTLDPGTPNRQEFVYDEPFEDDTVRGWRVEIEPDVRYTYGTMRDGEWRWRVDFDLTSPMAEPPPPPWGYEEGQAPPR